MHKSILLALFSLSSVFLVKAQKTSNKQFITSFATIEFPSKPTVLDTLGVRSFHYADSLADYIVTVKDMTEIEGFRLKFENLDQFYEGVKEGMLGANNGKLTSQKPFTIAGLKGSELIYTTPNPELPNLGFKRILFVDGLVIGIDMIIYAENEQQTKAAREIFFNSLSITGDTKLLKQETIGSTEGIANGFAYQLGKLTGYALIILLVIWVVKRLKRKKVKV